MLNFEPKQDEEVKAKTGSTLILTSNAILLPCSQRDIGKSNMFALLFIFILFCYLRVLTRAGTNKAAVAAVVSGKQIGKTLPTPEHHSHPRLWANITIKHFNNSCTVTHTYTEKGHAPPLTQTHIHSTKHLNTLTTFS